MTVEQADVFRRFVHDGGIIFASGVSSLDRKNNQFLLEDVFGVRFIRKDGNVATFLTPVDAELQKAIWPQDHLGYPGKVVVTEALPDTRILGKSQCLSWIQQPAARSAAALERSLESPSTDHHRSSGTHSQSFRQG